jgi:hypothetical protein
MKLSEYKLLKKYLYWNENNFDNIFLFNEMKKYIKASYKHDCFKFKLYLLYHYLLKIFDEIKKAFIKNKASGSSKNIDFWL